MRRASAQRLGLVGSGLGTAVSVDRSRVVVCGLGAAESPPAVLLRATGAAVRCTCTMRAMLQAAEAVA